MGADKQLPELPDHAGPGEGRGCLLLSAALPLPGGTFPHPVLLSQACSENVFPVSHRTLSALSLEPAPLVPRD